MNSIHIHQRYEPILGGIGVRPDKTIYSVNGIEDLKAHQYQDHDPVIYFYNEEVIELLVSTSFNEIAKYIPIFLFDKNLIWKYKLLTVIVYCGLYYREVFPRIQVTINLKELQHWQKPYSIASFANELKKSILDLRNPDFKYWQEEEETVLEGFGLEYYLKDITSLIQPEIEKILSLFISLVNEAEKTLLKSLNFESILTYFQFPNEIKSASQQYLIYFTQFMADMGIFVDTELKEELNQTLFRITPKNKNESLEIIQKALNIYLNAPCSLNFDSLISSQIDVAAKQWEANVYHLKSQLVLAKSILQVNQVTIESLQLLNYQYKQLLESRGQINNSRNGEDVIKGIVTVKKYEGKGFDIDFAEILRRLKRKLIK